MPARSPQQCNPLGASRERRFLHRPTTPRLDRRGWTPLAKGREHDRAGRIARAEQGRCGGVRCADERGVSASSPPQENGLEGDPSRMEAVRDRPLECWR